MLLHLLALFLMAIAAYLLLVQRVTYGDLAIGILLAMVLFYLGALYEVLHQIRKALAKRE